MITFKNLSIKGKLKLIIMVTSSISLLLAFVAFVVTDLISFRREMVRDLTFFAQTAGRASLYYLLYENKQSAELVLGRVLVNNPNVEYACVYDKNDEVFAQYIPHDVIRVLPPPEPQKDGFYFKANHLGVFRQITLEALYPKKTTGTIYIQSDLKELRSRFIHYMGIGVIILLTTFFIALLLSLRLQRFISNPILHLAKIAKTVSKNKDYSVRVDKQSNDEVGILVDGFNEMLSQIQDRDMKLEQHRQQLEQQVKNRTADLQKVNEDLRDQIIERERAEEQLQRAKQDAEVANRSKSDFLATMSHEIRTPLSAIIGMSKLALESNLNSEQQEYIETVFNSSDHLLSLINDILDFSKIEAGKLELEEIPFDLNKLIKDTVAIFAYQGEQKGLKLTYKIHDGVHPFIKGDLHRLRQIIVNLVGNAIKFTNAGEVSVQVKKYPLEVETQLPLTHEKTCEEGGTVSLLIVVEDTGIGISKDKLESIFDGFSQIDDSYKRKYGGTGLGLAISKHLALLMDGKIWVESEPDKGSRFFFTIHLKPATLDDINDREQRMREATAGLDVSQATRTLNILLVEDFYVNQKMIVPLLEKNGHKVKVVEDGKQAVEAVKKENFDLVLMDVQMPVMDGLEATKAIREHEKQQRMTNFKSPAKNGLSRKSKPAINIPIIALTAHAVKGDREKCLQAGMDGYVSKPIKAEVLFAVINKLSGAKESNNELPREDRAGHENNQSIDLNFTQRLTGGDKGILLEVCKAIVEKLPEELSKLNTAVAKKDAKSVERIVHTFKSTTKSVGAKQATEIAYQIELATADNNLEKAKQLLHDFKQCINTILIELRDYVAREERK